MAEPSTNLSNGFEFSTDVNIITKYCQRYGIIITWLCYVV